MPRGRRFWARNPDRPSHLELLFCAHRSRQYASALTKIGGRSIIREDEFAVT